MELTNTSREMFCENLMQAYYLVGSLLARFMMIVMIIIMLLIDIFLFCFFFNS